MIPSMPGFSGDEPATLSRATYVAVIITAQSACSARDAQFRHRASQAAERGPVAGLGLCSAVNVVGERVVGQRRTDPGRSRHLGGVG